MKSSEPPVIVEHTFKATPESVWNAITEHNEMIKWYFEDIPDFKAEKGFSTSFLIENEGRKFTHQWKVTEVKPISSIVYQWNYREYPGNSELSMELFPESDSTRLKITHRTIEDFPDHIPEFRRESCLQGWNYFVRERLSKFLN